jgi:hypothetical protein
MILGWLSIIVYIAALGYGGLRIYWAIQAQRSLAAQEFSELTEKVSTAGRTAFMDETFADSFVESVRTGLMNSSALQGVIILGPRGAALTVARKDGVIDWIGENSETPRFTTYGSLPPQVFFTPLSIEGLRNITMSVSAYFIDNETFITILKQTLIVILCSLSLAFVAFITNFLYKETRETTGTDTLEPGIWPEFSEETLAESPQETQPEILYENQDLEREMPQEIPPDFLYETQGPDEGDSSLDAAIDADYGLPDNVEEILREFEIPEFAADELLGPPEAPPADDKKPEPPIKVELFDEARDDMPPYSPRGIKMEAGARGGLETELQRSISLEQDLVVLVMNYQGEGGDEVAGAFASAVKEHFIFKNLIYEWKENGVLVIIRNTSLEEGLKEAEQFHEEVMGSNIGEKFPGKLGIGISSRSGRTVDAERLILEAEQAWRRSLSDPNVSVIAFKTDPEKYRTYMASF